MGPHGVIPLLRAFGMGPPKLTAPDRIDFRNLPRNTTRIKTLRFGSWVGGHFVGLGDGGAVYVRLDGEEQVREISNRPDVLRLEHLDFVAVVASTEDAKVIAEAPDGQMVAIADDFGLKMPPVAEAATHVERDDLPPEDHVDSVDWAAQAAGVNVWAQDEDGEVIQGKLHHTDEKGVYVLGDGDEKESGPFKNEDVFHAS